MRPAHERLLSRAARRRFLAPFTGQGIAPPPIWLMRQAGRYLPEYRATRTRAGGFLDLCYNPELATEVTLQPIRRYGFDAAILFSDILVVPHALGQDVSFAEGEGPRLAPIRNRAEIARLDPNATAARFELVYEAVARIRAGLPDETALIGFCGAPWTVATYVVGGRGSSDQADTRLWAYRDPAGFSELIDLLTDVSIEYLSGQVTAGADVLQIFDSWAGNLPTRELARWVIGPTKRMVAELNRRHPDVPIIGFARGSGASLSTYAGETGCDGIGCDTTLPMEFARQTVAERHDVVLQGNLDPLLLVAGGTEMLTATDGILDAMDGRPFIFNLGHGIVPQTPPEHVAQLVQHIRARS